MTTLIGSCFLEHHDKKDSEASSEFGEKRAVGRDGVGWNASQILAIYISNLCFPILVLKIVKYLLVCPDLRLRTRSYNSLCTQWLGHKKQLTNVWLDFSNNAFWKNVSLYTVIVAYCCIFSCICQGTRNIWPCVFPKTCPPNISIISS